MTGKAILHSEPVFVFPANPDDMTDEDVAALCALLNMDALRDWVRAALATEIEREGKDEEVA